MKDPGKIYDRQKSRCYTKSNSRYYRYGGRGIEIKYTKDEFIKWWEYNIKNFNGVNPSIDRIDNNGHYEFGNIQIISRSENSKKRIRESGNPTKNKEILILDAKTKEPLMIAKSIKEAAYLTDNHRISIKRIVDYKKMFQSKGYKYEYAKG